MPSVMNETIKNDLTALGHQEATWTVDLMFPVFILPSILPEFFKKSLKVLEIRPSVPQGLYCLECK